jgi:hypothetical protein
MRRAVIIVIAFLFTAQVGKPQDVYKTPSGKKYHHGSCRMVENVSKKITIAEALALALEACKICKPNTATANNLLSNAQTPHGQTSTVQCKGYTKAGNRCRHRTSIANGYCFQHNSDSKNN